MKLSKYSFGIGDRFGHEGEAQLRAIIKAQNSGVDITPVWNKSNREHEIIGTAPGDVRTEADQAVAALGWKNSYFVDADHITLNTVDRFMDCSDFFTIDVADYIGKTAPEPDIAGFVEHNRPFIGEFSIPGIKKPFSITEKQIRSIASKFLESIREAARIYNHIAGRKKDGVVIEVSMDEVETPQTPIELYFILKSLAEEGVRIHTIAPKFTGRFNKGVDYAGDLNQFAKEFEEDVLVIGHAVREHDLPADLKLSVHSGSDKFSIYAPISRIIRKYDAGIHVKTSGTTWLEELIGLALSGDDGTEMTKSIYKEAYKRFDELTGPYAPVIDVEYSKLAEPEQFDKWSGEEIAARLIHNLSERVFDPQLRQFLHCSYKIAAEKGVGYTDLLEKHSNIIGANVTKNLYERHIVPLFLNRAASAKQENIYEDHKS